MRSPDQPAAADSSHSGFRVVRFGQRTRASFLSLFFFFYSVFAASPLSCTKREEMDETGRGVKRRLVSYRESIGRRSRVRSSTITVTDDGLRMI
jgi:hypothetical protein